MSLNKEEMLALEIEKTSYQEVIKQMSKGGARMECGLNEFLRSIEKKIEEINQKLKSSNKENEVREIAHKMWVEDNCPDGEKLVEHFGKMVKLKDVHWHWAVVEWTYGPDYLRSW